MKKLIFLMALFCSVSFGQVWNSTIITSINEPNVEKMDLFTNKDGNHLLIKNTNGNIVYYNINFSGSVDNSKTITLESNGDFPNIVGSNDKIYAFYKAGDYIKFKYSTDGGASWNYNYQLDKYIGSELCNGIDAVYQNLKGVHLVYGIAQGNFETYYWRLTPSDSWTDSKNVSNYAGFPDGGSPSVAYSENRVHVSYNTNEFSEPEPGMVITRDKYNGVWQTPQYALSTNDLSLDEKLISKGNNLYLIYEKYINGIPIRVDLAYKYRSLNGTSWSSETVIENSVPEISNIFSLTKTSNDKLQLIYLNHSDELNYKNYDGYWDNDYLIDTTPSLDALKVMSNASNDLYVIWKHEGSNYLRYIQYDDIPLAPQNLKVKAYQEGNMSHPKLSWSFNNEPDVYISANGYQIWRRIRPFGGSWSGWSQINTVAGSVNYYVDYDITIEGVGTINTAEYKIRAVDVTSHYSPFSSWVSVFFGKFGKMASDATLMKENNYNYELAQNYPNPFNPSTEIKYSLAKDSYVTLKVYDMLGKEVAELVNGQQTAGTYIQTFNASNLPSGIYVYKLTAGKFSSAKKLMLMK